MTTKKETRFSIINTWNGGAGGRVIMFESQAKGDAGEFECMAWIHKNTPFSFSEALKNQGYELVPLYEKE